MKLKPADAVRAYCEQRGYPAPQFEVRFHPTRLWKFDAAWPGEKVAMEFHGGVWTHGRHTRGKGFTGDREKMNEAQLAGWRVLEVPTGWFATGEVYALLDRVFGGET